MYCKFVKNFAVKKYILYIEFFFLGAKLEFECICLFQVLYRGMRIILKHIRSCTEDGFAQLPEWLIKKFQTPLDGRKIDKSS